MAMVVQYLSELGRLTGGGAALVFAVALLASGVSPSSVGTHTGEVRAVVHLVSRHHMSE